MSMGTLISHSNPNSQNEAFHDSKIQWYKILGALVGLIGGESSSFMPRQKVRRNGA